MALLTPAAACRYNALRWLFVAFSAKQKEQRTPPAVNQWQHHLVYVYVSSQLGLILLIYSIFRINFSKFILSDPYTVDVAYRRPKPWMSVLVSSLFLLISLPVLQRDDDGLRLTTRLRRRRPRPDDDGAPPQSKTSSKTEDGGRRRRYLPQPIPPSDIRRRPSPASTQF